jgi:hypothetical protein
MSKIILIYFKIKKTFKKQLLSKSENPYPYIKQLFSSD